MSTKILQSIVSNGMHTVGIVNRSILRRTLTAKPPIKLPENKLRPKAAAPDDVDEDELEDMFVQGPKGIEWGGPTRGGKFPEPTRYGDWERKGRVTDF